MRIRAAVELVDRHLKGDIDVDPFVSHELELDEVNRGFELMEAQDGIRSVIKFAEAPRPARDAGDLTEPGGAV